MLAGAHLAKRSLAFPTFYRGEYKTYNFCEIRATLWASEAVLVPIPLVTTLVAIHHVPSLCLRRLRLTPRLVHDCGVLRIGTGKAEVGIRY